jgi:hypothetical protein
MTVNNFGEPRSVAHHHGDDEAWKGIEPMACEPAKGAANDLAEALRAFHALERPNGRVENDQALDVLWMV